MVRKCQNNEGHNTRRLCSLSISILVSLASGTPYLYGTYAPQFIKRVGLTTSDSATISLASTIGCGLGGIPGGLIIDKYGPPIAIGMGSVSILVGYYGLYKIYEEKVFNLWLISVSMVLMSFGSIISYFSTMKAVQANFPDHKGIAGCIPVSVFGLSATVFSAISATLFKQDVGNFLHFLALFCGSITFFGSWFVKIYDNGCQIINNVNPEPDEETRLLIKNTKDAYPYESNYSSKSFKLLTSTNKYSLGELHCNNLIIPNSSISCIDEHNPSSSTTSFVSNSFTDIQGLNKSIHQETSGPTISHKDVWVSSVPIVYSKNPLIYIKYLLTNKVFLYHFFIVSIASGIGQMYIYSIGFIVKAQINYRPRNLTVLNPMDNISPFANSGQNTSATLQALQVSLISISSFFGRIISGFLSDLIYKKYRIQRLWIVVGTILIFAICQFILVINSNRMGLIHFTSILTGGCYGLIFGNYPAIIADEFGTQAFSTTWGLICTGPMITLYALNKYFGTIYDRNTDSETGICYRGTECYKGAFKLSFLLCFAILGVTLFVIHFQRSKH
ncbi:unnamed protein product [Debaryomyces tyrocola]|nr:unnamed protein product [Debaryomyces tyrocola]